MDILVLNSEIKGFNIEVKDKTVAFEVPIDMIVKAFNIDKDYRGCCIKNKNEYKNEFIKWLTERIIKGECEIQKGWNKEENTPLLAYTLRHAFRSYFNEIGFGYGEKRKEFLLKYKIGLNKWGLGK